MQAAPVGHKVTIDIGDMKGTWVKLETDHTGQLNPGLKGELRPHWANVETGQVRHFSWLVDSHNTRSTP
jgi:hypothetical protein